MSAPIAGGSAGDLPAGILPWSTTWGLTAGVCAVGSEALLLSPVLKDIASEFSLTPAAAGLAVTIYGIALAVVAPFGGLISDRLSASAPCGWVC